MQHSIWQPKSFYRKKNNKKPQTPPKKNPHSKQTTKKSKTTSENPQQNTQNCDSQSEKEHLICSLSTSVMFLLRCASLKEKRPDGLCREKRRLLLWEAPVHPKEKEHPGYSSLSGAKTCACNELAVFLHLTQLAQEIKGKEQHDLKVKEQTSSALEEEEQHSAT